MLREESEEFFAYVSVGALADGYVISFLDLSDRREIEEELRQSEERYRTIADHLPRGLVHIMDRDLRYRFSAGEGLERLHLRHEELVGRSIFEILDPEDARVVAGAYRHVLETGEPVSFQGEYAGEVFLIRAVPLRASDGSIDQLLALSVTITEQHRAEEALRASEAQFRRLVEGSPDPILVHVDGTVRFVNPSARRLFSCGPPDELIGKDIRDLFTDDCRRLGEDWLPESGRPPGAPPIEATIAGCDPPRMVELMSTPSRFEGEDATILSLRDITSRKEYERRIVSLNRQLTAVGQIVQLANSSLDLQEMEERILSGIIDTLGFDAGCIYLKDTDQKTAILSAEKNLPEWFRERWAEINMHHYPYNLIFYAGRPRYLENTPEHQISMLDVPFLEDAGVISLAAVPLRADATVMGGLFVGKFEEGWISAEEQRTLEMIGSELGEMLVRGQIQEELMASRGRARRILDLLEHDFQTQRALLHEYASQLEGYHDDTLSRIAGWVHESLERTAYIYKNCSILRKILDPLPTDTVGLDGVVHRAIDSVPGLVFSWTDTGHSVQAGDLLEDALIFLVEQMVGRGEGPLIGEVEESGERVILTIRGPVSSLSATAAMRVFEEEISPADPLFRLQAARLIIERYGGEFTISDQMVGGSPDLEVRLSLHGGGEDHRDDDGIGAVPDGTLTGEDLV
ncbi:MAG: PAS domain-containing protein [Methanomicrobiales archaeon]